MDASDMKELRVILDNINVLNDEWFDTFPTDERQTCIHDSLEYEITKANKMLAKRPRQCDVGTAYEQGRRYKATGEVYHTSTLTNVLAWAQTPYAEEGAGK